LKPPKRQRPLIAIIDGGGRPGYRLDALGRASRQPGIPVHAPVCSDRERQHGCFLEPGTTRHRADARC
jgi:hypothetical protein